MFPAQHGDGGTGTFPQLSQRPGVQLPLQALNDAQFGAVGDEHDATSTHLVEQSRRVGLGRCRYLVRTEAMHHPAVTQGPGPAGRSLHSLSGCRTFAAGGSHSAGGGFEQLNILNKPEPPPQTPLNLFFYLNPVKTVSLHRIVHLDKYRGV